MGLSEVYREWGGMKLTELLLLVVVGWSGIGLIGVAISLNRGERRKVRRGLAWLGGVWVVYAGVLLGVSLKQRQRVVAMGEPQCFDEMCFAVERVEEAPGFLIRDGERLLRVSVLVSNRGREPHSDGTIQAYLIDRQGRRWEESLGVGGVGLGARVAGGDTAICEPVFKIAGDATGLKLVFTHGWMQPGVLEIGDSDSLLHRRTVVDLMH